MVKLTEVEDEHFADKPSTTKDDALLASDDDDDYTDTGAMIPCSLKLATPTRGPRRL
jgi:mitochondrial import receptor subunit TOM22